MHKEAFDRLSELFPDDTVEDLEQIKVGVSGSRVVRASLNGGGHKRDIVAKFGRNISLAEREGAGLLAPYLDLPEELPVGDDSCYVTKFVPGANIDCWVGEGGLRTRERAFLDFVRQNLRMWNLTASVKPATCGYPMKIEGTVSELYRMEIGGILLSGIADRPLSVNGLLLPSLDSTLLEIRRQLDQCAVTVLSHGDEGAGNGIYTPDRKLVMVDNGTSGRRVLVEPISKALMWFPATRSNGKHFKMKLSDSGIDIRYYLDTPPAYSRLAQEALDEIMVSPLGHRVRPRQLAAACALYLFREMKWAPSRGRSGQLPFLFAHALSIGTRIFFSPYQRKCLWAS